jgi:predicted nucleotidyltransferase
MAGLNDAERACLTRYCDLLAQRLAGLVEVRMFGSAARGDMWPPDSPMHSDIDLLVVTRDRVHERKQEELLDATYPLYLECGRQLSPHFFSEARLAAPEDERTQAFLARIGPDAVVVWPVAPDPEADRPTGTGSGSSSSRRPPPSPPRHHG